MNRCLAGFSGERQGSLLRPYRGGRALGGPAYLIWLRKCGTSQGRDPLVPCRRDRGPVVELDQMWSGADHGAEYLEKRNELLGKLRLRRDLPNKGRPRTRRPWPLEIGIGLVIPRGFHLL